MSQTPDTTAMHIRAATGADAAAVREIYRPFVESTSVSFVVVVPTVSEMERRLSESLRGWLWLIAEVKGEVVGYAYGSAHRARAAYRYSVETSAYVDAKHHRRGIARALYAQLLTGLVERGFGNAYAGITLPNEASVGLHESLGFKPIGVFPRVGRKFGAWHDVAWLHLSLQDTVQDDKNKG
jgi:phosphinothricin acetyltransferase